MKGKKVVKAEVDLATYARLKHLAGQRGMPLKAIFREALQSYVNGHEGELDLDPIFRNVGRIKTEGRSWSERKDWRP